MYRPFLCLLLFVYSGASAFVSICDAIDQGKPTLGEAIASFTQTMTCLSGDPPLHIAVGMMNSAIAGELLDAGANPILAGGGKKFQSSGAQRRSEFLEVRVGASTAGGPELRRNRHCPESLSSYRGAPPVRRPGGRFLHLHGAPKPITIMFRRQAAGLLEAAGRLFSSRVREVPRWAAGAVHEINPGVAVPSAGLLALNTLKDNPGARVQVRQRRRRGGGCFCGVAPRGRCR